MRRPSRMLSRRSSRGSSRRVCRRKAGCGRVCRSSDYANAHFDIFDASRHCQRGPKCDTVREVSKTLSETSRTCPNGLRDLWDRVRDVSETSRTLSASERSRRPFGQCPIGLGDVGRRFWITIRSAIMFCDYDDLMMIGSGDCTIIHAIGFSSGPIKYPMCHVVTVSTSPN